MGVCTALAHATRSVCLCTCYTHCLYHIDLGLPLSACMLMTGTGQQFRCYVQTHIHLYAPVLCRRAHQGDNPQRTWASGAPRSSSLGEGSSLDKSLSDGLCHSQNSLPQSAMIAYVLPSSEAQASHWGPVARSRMFAVFITLGHLGISCPGSMQGAETNAKKGLQSLLLAVLHAARRVQAHRGAELRGTHILVSLS